MDITLAISRATGFSYRNVAAVIEMLETGDTIPFISRYRKEATGGLDEVAIFEISRLKDSFLALDKRRKTIIDTITEQGHMTPELLEKIENAEDSATLEDIYLPYKPKRRTRAQIAREKGLENLAKILMAQRSANLIQIARKFINDNVASPEDAIDGAKDIAAEWISERENVRKSVRARFLREAKIVSSVVTGEEENAEKYRNYFDFSEPLSRCPSHRYLAMRRGEAEGFLKVGLKIDDKKAIERISEMIIKKEANSDFRRALIDAITDS